MDLYIGELDSFDKICRLEQPHINFLVVFKTPCDIILKHFLLNFSNLFLHPSNVLKLVYEE